MAVSLIRIDDRVIHGQIVVAWSNLCPCDGIVAVDDTAANNPVIKNTLKSACQKKTFIWTYEKFKTKAQEMTASKKNYFLICRNPINMAKILVDLEGFEPGMTVLNVGPQPARPGVETISIGRNADITKEEAEAYERISKAGYDIEFQLTPDAAKVLWKDARNKFDL